MAKVYLSLHPLVVKSPFLHDSVLGRPVYSQELDISSTAAWSNIALGGEYNVAKYMVARLYGDVEFSTAVGSNAYPAAIQQTEDSSAAIYIPANTEALLHIRVGDLVACAPLGWS